MREFRRIEQPPLEVGAALEWAATSFGLDGRREEGPIAPPPQGIEEAAAAVEWLRRSVRRKVRRFAADLDGRVTVDERGDSAEWSLRSAEEVSAR